MVIFSLRMPNSCHPINVIALNIETYTEVQVLFWISLQEIEIAIEPEPEIEEAIEPELKLLSLKLKW